MPNGRLRFRQWMERSRLNQRETADLLGIHFTHVNQILLGRRTPGLDVAVRIERTTGIPVDAWAASPTDTAAVTSADAPVIPHIDKQ